MSILDTIDLPAAAAREYHRREASSARMIDQAANETEAARLRTLAHADLRIWQDIYIYLIDGLGPHDHSDMRRSVRTTMERAKESGVDNAKLLELIAICRAVETRCFRRPPRPAPEPVWQPADRRWPRRAA